MAETKESDDTPTSPPEHPGPPPNILNWTDYMRKHKHKHERRVCSHYGEEYTPSHPMLQFDCMRRGNFASYAVKIIKTTCDATTKQIKIISV